MKALQFYCTALAIVVSLFASCKKDKKEDDPNTGTSSVKLSVNGELKYETNIVNAYYATSPLAILSLASTKDKNAGGAAPQFTFQTMAFDGKLGTIRIVHGDGNTAAYQLNDVSPLIRYDISNRDADGNRGYLDVTITAMRQSGAVKVLTGTFNGRLIGDKKTVIEVSGSFNDHAYPHYGD